METGGPAKGLNDFLGGAKSGGNGASSTFEEGALNPTGSGGSGASGTVFDADLVGSGGRGALSALIAGLSEALGVVSLALVWLKGLGANGLTLAAGLDWKRLEGGVELLGFEIAKGFVEFDVADDDEDSPIG
jgi:hypothetical protein